jgi:hypothetical protein
MDDDAAHLGTDLSLYFISSGASLCDMIQIGGNSHAGGFSSDGTAPSPVLLATASACMRTKGRRVAARASELSGLVLFHSNVLTKQKCCEDQTTYD